jgi:hypothetical protein
MTTHLHDVVVVDPDGLARACSYCLSRERLRELSRQHLVSHAICASCLARLNAQLDALERAAA